MNSDNERHSSEPWNIQSVNDAAKIQTQIYSDGEFIASTATCGELPISIEEENAMRIVDCVNSFIGISDFILEKILLNESTQKIFSLHIIEWIMSNPHVFSPNNVVICNDPPWKWLESSVVADGEGYLFLQSPAGGIMRITNEQREHIVACVNACKHLSTEELENKI